MSLDEVSTGEEGGSRDREQKDPQTLSLVKDKSHRGDPGGVRGAGEKPGEGGVHRPSGFKEEGGTSCV